MREMFCTDPCGTNQALALVAAPCFVCLGDLSPVPPDAPGPVTVVFGAPPPAQVLDGGNFVAGSGISAEHASVGSDGALALFLTPLIAGVPGSEAAPVSAASYAIELADGQELAVAFGAALLSGAYTRITDYYDVVFNIDANGAQTTLTLAEGDSLTGLVWQNVAENYVITDSEGSAMNVQNVTRLTYLVDAGLLPAGATDPGSSLWQLVATRKGTGEMIAVAFGVNVTAAEAL